MVSSLGKVEVAVLVMERKKGTYPKPVCFLTPAKTVEIARASKA
jgi:hypothetical protein